jgi:hypothetical protein
VHYLTPRQAADRKGYSVSRIQHFCRAYARRVEERGLIPPGNYLDDGSSPREPPSAPQLPGELKCTWVGQGRHRAYYVDPDALAALPRNELDPTTGRQRRRGRAAGWTPVTPYAVPDERTDLRLVANAPLRRLAAVLAAAGVPKLYDLLRAGGFIQDIAERHHVTRATGSDYWTSAVAEVERAPEVLAALARLYRARHLSVPALERVGHLQAEWDSDPDRTLASALQCVLRAGTAVSAAAQRSPRKKRARARRL